MTTLVAPDRIRAYWDREDVESMYDKLLLAAEIALISARIPEGSRVLDAGCGEGEGTLAYAAIPGVVIDALDFSRTRTRKAAERLVVSKNVRIFCRDLRDPSAIQHDYDVIVSQRCLINLLNPDEQDAVLDRFLTHLSQGGRLILLEGSQTGAAELDAVRAGFGLPPIPIPWHNRFLDDLALWKHMDAQGASLLECTGLGEYYVLTRGIRPALEAGPWAWDCPFNQMAASRPLAGTLKLGARGSRTRLWVFQKHL